MRPVLKNVLKRDQKIKDIFQCLTVFGFGGKTETESQPPKPKPIQKIFATEIENRNRKSATETETDSKYFCHRNRKLKPIDKKQLIIVQYEKSETTKNGVLFLLHF